jgi:hypothetical protein
MVKIVKPYNENNVLSIAPDNAQFGGMVFSGFSVLVPSCLHLFQCGLFEVIMVAISIAKGIHEKKKYKMKLKLSQHSI